MKKFKLTNGRRALLYILTPLFCAFLCLGAVFSISLNNNKVTASAATAEAVTINELTLNGSGVAINGFVFNQDNLNTLYNKILSQQSGATLADIKSKISGTATYDGAGTVNKMINSNEINGGAVLKVKFGGLEWQVTSVTTSNNADSDVIATLWLTDNNSSIETNAYSYGNYYTDSLQTYQTNVYGTSHMRVVTLNAGGQYVIANSSKQGALSTWQSQSSSNKFAKFTMTSLANNLTDYIVQPKYVDYQSQESWAGSGDTNVPYCCPNEAYGTPYVATWRAGLEVMVDKTDYTAWKNDYLWLPSLTETGAQGADSPQTKANGIWDMTAASRARAAAYLRSASNASAANIIYLTSEGKFRSNYPNVSAAAVRPALHLNLTKAQAASPTVISTKPSASENLKYNGNEQTFIPTNFDSNAMEITGNTATAVGDYSCMVTLKAGYAWNNTTYDRSSVTIPYKVEKGTPNFTFGYVETDIDLTKLYIKDYETLPAIQNVHSNPTPGNLSWNAGETPDKDRTTPYGWTFTPTESGNYNVVTGSEPLVFKDAAITGLQVTKNDGKDIYDKYNTRVYSSLEAYIKSCITIKIKYEDNTVSASPVADGDYTVTTTDISVTSGNSQEKTINVRIKNTAENTQLRGMTGTLTTEVNKALITSISVEQADDFKALSYPFTIADVKANYDVYLGWNFANLELLADADKVTVTLKDGGELGVGNLTFTFTYTDGGLTQSKDINVTIAQGVYDVADVTLTGDKNPVYNGQAHALTLSKAVPTGVTAVISYKKDGETEASPTAPTDAGTYTVTLTFTQEDTTNYETITKTVTETLTIVKAVYNVADITLSGNKTPVYDGQAHALTLSKAVPAGVTAVITYKKDGETEASPTAPTDAGTYTVTLTFTQADTTNYETITKTVNETLTIAQADYPNAGNISFVGGGTITHDGNSHKLEATGVPDGVTVTYKYGSAEQPTPFEFEDINESGYTVTAIFSHTNPNYKTIANKQATLIITDKHTYNVSNLAFTVSGASGANGEYTATYSPESNISFTLGGKLLNVDGGEVTPNLAYKYEKSDGNGGWTEVEAAELKNAGEYRVTATATTGDTTYSDIQPFVATLTIAKANYNSVEFKNSQVVYDGEEHTLTVTGTLSDGITATYTVEGQGDTTSFTEIGEYEFTVTFNNPDTENYNDMQPLTATLKIVEPSATGISASVEVGTYLDVTNNLDDLKPHITVTINLTGNNSETTDDFELSCSTLRDGGLFEVGQQTVTVTHGEYIATVTVTVDKATLAHPVYSGKLGYTGNEIKPKATDFQGFDSAIMTFVESKLQGGVNAGTYKAVFALTDAKCYEWASATSAATYSKKPFAKAVTLDGEAADIQLAANEIAVEWNVAKAVVTATKASSGLPVFKSESYKGSWGNAVTLKYFTDETCIEEVAADKLETGKQYFAKVELVDAANFSLDDSLSGFLDPFPYTAAAPAIASDGKVLEFLKANWLWIVLAVAVLILLIIIIVLARRLSKKRRYSEEHLMRFVPAQDMSQIMAMMHSAPTGGSAISPELFAILSGMNSKIDMLQKSASQLIELPAPTQKTTSSEQSAANISEIVEAAVKKALAENATAKSANSRPARKDLGSRPLVDSEVIRRAEEPLDDGRIVDWGGFYNRVDEQDIEDIGNFKDKKNK